MSWPRVTGTRGHGTVVGELARYNVDAEQIEVAGVTHDPAWEDTETYQTAAGEVPVRRHRYRPAGHNAKSLCLLELRVRIVNSSGRPARHGRGRL